MLKKILLVTVVIGVGWLVWSQMNRWVEEEMAIESVAFPGGDVPIRVVATFYPLQEIARGVVGELGEVTSVVPAGTEPHDFEPTPAAIKSMYEADLVVINGAGIDPWAEKLASDLASKGVAVKVLANEVELLRAEADDHEGETTHEEEGGYDPHFWLDPVIVASLAKNMQTTIAERFPDEKQILEENIVVFTTKLEALDAEYRTGLAACRLKEVVASHNAFGYLAQRYGFTVHALSGISPEEEPAPRKLVEIAQEVRESGIRYIFFETLVSPKLTETLAQEVGAGTLVFNPIEGVTPDEAARGENYFSLMRSNLKALQKALECQ